MPIPARAKPSFCAICIDVATDLQQRPIGPKDALVWVCTACDTDTPVATDGPDRGYEVPEKASPIGSIQEAFARGANKVSRPPPRRGGMSLIPNLRPGFLLVRVPRIIDGTAVDSKEARATLRRQPWFRDVRHLGSDFRYHLFERPDDKLAAKVRGEVNDYPNAGLARLSGR